MKRPTDYSIRRLLRSVNLKLRRYDQQLIPLDPEDRTQEQEEELAVSALLKGLSMALAWVLGDPQQDDEDAEDAETMAALVEEAAAEDN